MNRSRQRGQGCVPTVEPLQARWMMSRDLRFDHGEINPDVRPGAVANVTLVIRNDGTQAVTQSFYVEMKLVRVPNVGHVVPDFYDPTAVVLAKQLVTADVAPGPLGHYTFKTTIAYPAELAPGRYSVATAVDSTLAVAESNESNNYLLPSGTRIFPADGAMTFEATSGADYFRLHESVVNDQQSIYLLTINDWSESFFQAQVTSFDLRGLGGDDVFEITGHIPGLRIDGQDGDDKIVGGDGNDFLVGGAGKDQIDGGLGNDRLNGNGGNDKLFGGAGADRLYGYAGNDYLDGGSSGDRLEGGAGTDILIGQSGNDRFFAADGETDQLFGGSGDDQADRDVDDILAGV